MSTLRSRVSWQMPEYPSKRPVATYGNINHVPLVRIAIYPGVITYEDMEPLIAGDGAPIAATGRGSWGQLYKAG